jgi:hypothetical protein
VDVVPSEERIPRLTSWVEYSIAGALYVLADRDGVCRKFQREIAAHTDHIQATVSRHLALMERAGAIVIVEQGKKTPPFPIPKGYKLHTRIRAFFPARLQSHQKRKIRNINTWNLEPGVHVKQSGKHAGEPWHSSSSQSQRWFLQRIAMEANTDLEADCDLEELAQMMGFRKKKKAAPSSAAVIARDLENFRRIARKSQFDEGTGACKRTVIRIPDDSGFIPKRDATTARPKNNWPPKPL